MPTEGLALRQTPAVALSASTIAGALVALAMVTCSIVFSEPAVADVLMLLVIGAVPVIGVSRYGKAALVNLVLLLALVGLGLLAMPAAKTPATAIPHQFVTLFLAIGAFVIAGYIAADPEPRFKLIMWGYVASCMVATTAALVGYFDIVPGLQSLFTNYGRARGTFKDPNVYGAAVVPALLFIFWSVLRHRHDRTWINAALAAPLLLGLLLSFSRGAWISAVIGIALMLWLSAVRTRRKSDRLRFAMVVTVGLTTVFAALGAATQMEKVRGLLQERASLDQSYDNGPEGRFGGQAKARALILENPFGIGTHTFRAVHHHEEPHNVYLSMMLNAGWAGGAAFVASMLVTLFAGLRGSLRLTALQGPFIIATSAFAGLVVEGFVIDSDHWRHFFIIMACIWGLADADVPYRDPSRRSDDPADA